MIAQRIVFFIAGAAYATSWWMAFGYGHGDSNWRLLWIIPGLLSFWIILICAVAIAEHWNDK